MRPSLIRILITLLLLLLVVGWAIPTAANFAIEYNWWKEIGQIPSWLGILWYRTTPLALGTRHRMTELRCILHRQCDFLASWFIPGNAKQIKPVCQRTSFFSSVCGSVCF